MREIYAQFTTVTETLREEEKMNKMELNWQGKIWPFLFVFRLFFSHLLRLQHERKRARANTHTHTHTRTRTHTHTKQTNKQTNKQTKQNNKTVGYYGT